MSIPFSTKTNERLIGQSIVGEMHIIGIVGTATYAPGFIRLVEVPEGPFPSVTIAGYAEIASGIPTGTQFLVDYTTGVVTFSTVQDGNSVSVSYTGLGSEFAAEDVNELQNPLSTIASQFITYNWPLAPTVTWALAPLNQALNANSHKINNVTDPTSAQDVATKNYVDTHTAVPGSTNGAVQFNSSSSFGGDATNFFWDSTNFRLGLGTNSPSVTLQVVGKITASDDITTGSGGGRLISDQLIGRTGDLTLKPFVDGTHSIELAKATGAVIFSVDTTNSRVGINTVTPAVTLDLVGSTNVSGTALIGGSSIDASAQLEVDSTTKGFLPPRMTTTQRNAISSPATGLLIYNSTDNQWEGWNGSSWAVLG